MPFCEKRAPTISTAHGPVPAPTRDMRSPRRGVEEIPLPQPPLLVASDEHALALEHKKPLLRLSAWYLHAGLAGAEGRGR